MASMEEALGKDARETEEKMRLSDHGMAMDADEIPKGAKEDGHEGAGLAPAHRDD